MYTKTSRQEFDELCSRMLKDKIRNEPKMMNDKLLLEVREVMFNEEFRAMLRRNLYSLDHEDVSSALAKSLLKNLRIQKSPQMRSNLLEAG